MNKSTWIMFAALFSILSSSCQTKANQEISIIPEPVSLQIADGQFTLEPSTVINVVSGAKDLSPACQYFSDLSGNFLSSPMRIEEGPAKKNAINIIVDTLMKKEGYELTVNSKQIDMKAGSSQAVFYAFQSLRQMLPASIETKSTNAPILIQNVFIQDFPRFEHRGMMLDVCRHIFSMEDVKTFIDLLALHKMNRFHWHLTDDQGWRIEIKKYPELTKIGSKRSGTVIGHNSGKYDDQPYGGFFTQEQAKEIVKYAADRYITVIPEIELPGHATAALTAYPWLGCTGGPYEVIREWGIFEDVFCAGNDKTVEFLQDVFDEIIPIFPSEYIHIGGDECPRDAWKKCSKCQARIKQEHLKNEDELQSYLVHRMEQHLNSKGKKIIGWDEILEGGVSKTATVMSWRGSKGGIEAAKMGNHVIMAPNNYAYFDYYQSQDRANEPDAIGGFVDVAKVYSLEPASGLTPEEGEMILGVQANLWTEYIGDFRQVEYMVLPRIAALSEVSWTPAGRKNYPGFIGRATRMLERYQALGYNYATHILSATGYTTLNSDSTAITLELAPVKAQTEIRYTTDGSEPTIESTLYQEPVTLTMDCEVKARLFTNGQPEGKTLSKKIALKK